MNRNQFLKLLFLFLGCAILFGLSRVAPVAAAGRTFYVAPTGNDNNPGTEAAPWATLQKAANVMIAGDTALVKNGTYTKYAHVGAFVYFPRSGTRDAWITLKAYPGHKPKIVSPVWNAVLIERQSYIEVSGFEIQGINSTMSKNSGNGITASYAHHIIFKNNDVYDFPGGGISGNYSDYIIVENNKVHNTSKIAPYRTSAISLFWLTNSDGYTGYHSIVDGNIVWDNANTIGRPSDGMITDGNCIIIDRSRHPDANQVPVNPYTGKTLIQNNVCFNNGGRGIHVYRSDWAYVTNNTLYMNQYTPSIDMGELSALYSGNSQFYNNVVYARPDKIANNAHKANNITWGRNLYYNALSVNPRSSTDLVGVNPQFVAPSTNPLTANFNLLTTSPALNLLAAGSGYIPNFDVVKNRRPFDIASDLGAYELMTLVTKAPQPTATPPVAPTATPPPIPSGPALLLTVQPATAPVGQKVNVNLQLKSVSNVYGLDVKCTVNPAVLTGAARTDGTVFTAANSFFVDGGYKTDGTWMAAASLLNPAPAFTGDGVAFMLSYNVAAAGGSDVNCTATGVDRDGRSVQMTVVKGVFNGGGTTGGMQTMALAADTALVDPARDAAVMDIPSLDTSSLTVVETSFDAAALIAPAAPPVMVASVSGLAAYQNRADQMGIVIRLLGSDNTQLAELVTNADGSFSFTDVPDGTYTLQLSAPQHLPMVTTVTVSGGQPVALGALALLGGDTDGSSLIDLSDAALIGANFHLAVPPAPANADLNGDGEIDVADLVLVGSNFGSAGPVTAPAP